MSKIMTRTDYLIAHKNDGPAAFQAYYGQIASAVGVKVPEWLLIICASGSNVDGYWNEISTKNWYALALPWKNRIHAELKKRGDGWSDNSGICVMKAAVRPALAARLCNTAA